jgi:hypothetical protein
MTAVLEGLAESEVAERIALGKVTGSPGLSS